MFSHRWIEEVQPRKGNARNPTKSSNSSRIFFARRREFFCSRKNIILHRTQKVSVYIELINCSLKLSSFTCLKDESFYLNALRHMSVNSSD